MNMVLFGDGHSNINQIDSLENPIDEKFEIVLSNIPYSQPTDFGSLYSIPTSNADSVCLQHIWRALKPDGRAAVIVPETFLYEDGEIGKTRELIVSQCKEFSVFSLPRGVFNPYTPTKTNILYFKKGGQFSKSLFFVINNDGFELKTKRKPIEGDSDIKLLLGTIDNPKNINGVSTIVSRTDIKKSGNWNLRPFYYMEDIPTISGKSVYLSENIIEEITDKVDPRLDPDNDWKIIEVSQNGIFLGDILKGSEINQCYKTVNSGDIVYNPHRINIGSIGVVPPFLDKSLVSPAYVIVRVKNRTLPPSYIVSILKQERYLRVIMNYSLASARASLPFSELKRIVIPLPSKKEIEQLNELESQLENQLQIEYKIKNDISKMVTVKID